MNENEYTFIQISFRFVHMDANDGKSSLVQAMAWHRSGGKPLSVPVMAKFTDAGLTALLYWDGENIQEEQDQWHDCWCPGSLRHEVIISNGIDCVG